jgi:8-hydroxy-5-deazaflavin:NADPH oxidoreductase
MKIGIIGAGKIGTTIANLFIKAGHAVALSNSRGPASLKTLVKSLGDNAIALTVNDAAKFGDIVFLAVPWSKPEALPDTQFLQDKIVIDAMNHYIDSGKLADLEDSTASEETAKRLPGAIIVKAFNTIYFKHLNEASHPKLPLQERRAIFMASDSVDAKAKVSRLIEEIGFAAIDTGSLREGGKLQQPESDFYNKDISCAEAHEMLKKA